MKDLPLLFTDTMMRANISGIKTQTRRLRGLGLVNADPDRWHLWQPRISEASGEWAFSTNAQQGEKGEIIRIKCPYGVAVPGRKVWAREAHVQAGTGAYFYRADGEVSADERDWHYTPGIHMRRGACRFERPLIRIRCERLQSISEADAIAESCIEFQATNAPDVTFFSSAVAEYKALWNAINPDMPWARNPYVWVIEYQNQGSNL